MCKRATVHNARHKRQKLYNKQQGRCIYCNRSMWLPASKYPGKKSLMATLEHIVPVANGGASNLTNLAVSCEFCNNTKGKLSHDVFLHIRRLEHWQTVWDVYKRLGSKVHAPSFPPEEAMDMTMARAEVRIKRIEARRRNRPIRKYLHRFRTIVYI